ncbi:MAG: DUF2617 family protein [Maioricimonas sp. JB049]
MKVGSARPDASQLAFRLYERSLHPELFRVSRATLMEADDFSAMLRICDAGHVIELRHGGTVITEVVGAVEQELPQRGMCVGERLASCRDRTLSLEGNLTVHTSAHVERLDPEVFSEIQSELQMDARRAAVACEFPTAHRMQTAPLSVIQADANGRSLAVHAFHTFPETAAVVRTQTLYEF